MVCLAKSSRRLEQRIQYGLKVECRTTYDLKQVRGRGLLLQRFGELSRALLLRLEQAHVLDGDHRLIAEGGHQFDLLFGKGTGLFAHQDDNADGGAFSRQRDAQSGPEARNALSGAELILRISLDIRNVDRAAFGETRPASVPRPAGWALPTRDRRTLAESDSWPRT